jgi:dihydrofolate reductase/thymidylate synthase
MEKFNVSKIYYNFIVAISKNKGIGLKGKLPWNLPADMAYFKETTTKVFSQSETDYHNTSFNFINTAKEIFNKYHLHDKKKSNKRNMVVMGRNTWESIPEKFRPLSNRINVVLSSNEEFHSNHPIKKELFYTSRSIEYIFDLAGELKSQDMLNEIYVIGGTKVFDEFLKNYPDQCKLIFQTNINKNFESDVFFEIPNNFHPLYVSKTFAGNEDIKENNNNTNAVDNQITYDYRILFNQNITNDQNLMENFNQIINPYFVTKYPKHEEFQYLDTMRKILETGSSKNDRTGVGTISNFGVRMSYDCSQTFPLLTTKDTFWRGIVEELIWFIKGDTSAKDLQDKKVHIWDGNSSREYLDKLGLKEREVGDLGPVYGFQWRHFGAEYKTMHHDYTGEGVDQLKEVIDTIKNNPNSRRIIMSAWNPSDLKIMALPPCHVLCQFYLENNKLNLQMYQRSGDMGLGVPFNIASYSLLLVMVAHVTGKQPGNFIHIIGDTHIYKNHIDAIRKQLLRTPKPFPILKINRDVKNIEDFKFEDFTLINYNHWPKIKMEMAV